MRQTPTLQDLYRDVRPQLEAVDKVIRGALESDRTEIAEMATLAAGYGGKRMRPAMVFLVARAVGGVDPRHDRLAAVVELIHLGSLVHDDVIDRATIRRRSQTLHARFNPHDAVLLGDIIFARAIRVLASMGDERSLSTLTTALSTVCEGEILQNLRAHDPLLAEETYYEIIDAKTAELYARGCELSAHLSGAPEKTVRAFETFGRELGLAFQITDDCLDLVGREAEVGKSLGSDLTEGKMTLPLILTRRALGDRDRRVFDDVIRGGVDGSPDFAVIQDRVREERALEESLLRARGHVEQGLAAVRAVLDADAFAPLEAVGTFVLSRRS